MKAGALSYLRNSELKGPSLDRNRLGLSVINPKKICKLCEHSNLQFTYNNFSRRLFSKSRSNQASIQINIEQNEIKFKQETFLEESNEVNVNIKKLINFGLRFRSRLEFADFYFRARLSLRIKSVSQSRDFKRIDISQRFAQFCKIFQNIKINCL